MTGREATAKAYGRKDFGLRVDHVTFEYARGGREAVRALQDVSFEAAPGSFVSIVGPSGCGKSTLLRIVSGLAPPTAGTAYLGDEPVAKPTSDVGFVFQQAMLLPWKNITENVLLPCRMVGRVTREDRARAAQLLETVGLTQFAKAKSWELSGGMQQRAAIARALIRSPHVLLMDEPFGALDALTRDQMAVELQRVWKETNATVLFVTHSIQEAVLLSDHVVVMTGRPGNVANIVPIDLPRPRTLDVIERKEFTDASLRIRDALGSDGHSPALDVAGSERGLDG